jgi:pyroglutamyl-peptidase
LHFPKGGLSLTILITAFAPFQQESINATMEALKLLPDTVNGAALHKHDLPVVFGQATEELCELVDSLRPDAVVCLGQASGRAEITPERVAINVMDARIPDNGGNQPVDVPVRAGGPAAYFSTLPVKQMVHAMKDAGVPASVSNTAGTFVCNNLMYGLLDHLARTGKNIPAGFIHIPATPAQACDRPTPSMGSETAAKGLEAALHTLIMK